MDLKEYLIDGIMKIQFGNSISVSNNPEDLRQRAIEYIKENHYSLSEENVRYTINKLKNQGESFETIENERKKLNELEIPQLVDQYNEKIRNCVGIISKGVSPVNLINMDEEVVFSTYTIIKIDPRLYEGLKDYEKEIVNLGLLGSLFITPGRIVMDCVNSIFPIVTTTCFPVCEISSCSLTGVYSDELEIVLKSGQKIKVGLFWDDRIDTFKRVVDYVMSIK